MSAGFDYVRLASKVDALLAAAGRTVQFVPPQPPADSAAPWEGPGADAEPISVVAVGVGPSLSQLFGRGGVTGTGGVIGRAGRVLISASVVLPEPLGPGWSLLDGGLRITLSSLRIVKPGSVGILYVGEVQG